MNNCQSKIVFKGELFPGFDPAEVKKSLEQRFKIDVSKLEQLFSGVTVVVKNNITVEQAIKQHEKFKFLGLVTYIKEESIKSNTTVNNPVKSTIVETEATTQTIKTSSSAKVNNNSDTLIKTPYTKIIFKGELLPGFDLEAVKRSLVQRFNVNATKLEQLFSGATVVLKQNITVEQALKHHEKFKFLGLITYIKEAPIKTATTVNNPVKSTTVETKSSTKTINTRTSKKVNNNSNTLSKTPLIKLIFKGELLPGFDVVAVKKSLAQRFNVDVTKIEQLFSGNAVVLKKNITIEQAINYRQQLKSLGLITYTVEELQLKEVVNNTKVPPIWGWDFSGRYGRLNFIHASLIILLISLGINLMSVFLSQSSNLPVSDLVIFNHVAAGIMLLFFLRIIILRLHDLDTSAWWVLLFIPTLCCMFALVQVLTAFNIQFYLLILALPWVKTLFILIMLPAMFLVIKPGIKGINRYGLSV